VNLAGPWALRALAKLDPDLAVEHLPLLPILELGPTKHWYVPELLAKRPAATRAQLLSMMRRAEDPYDIALVFQDDEDSLDENMLDVLLSALGVCPSIAFRTRGSNNPVASGFLTPDASRSWHEQDLSRVVA
jgi:hypothetical protein